MKICPHGKTADACPWNVPWNSFRSCTNIERAKLDINWCGETSEKCKGRYTPFPRELKNNQGNKSGNKNS